MHLPAKVNSLFVQTHLVNKANSNVSPAFEQDTVVTLISCFSGDQKARHQETIQKSIFYEGNK